MYFTCTINIVVFYKTIVCYDQLPFGNNTMRATICRYLNANSIKYPDSCSPLGQMRKRARLRRRNQHQSAHRLKPDNIR